MSGADDETQPAELIERLVRLLDVETLDSDLFRGPLTHEPWQRVFGGQVVAQALMAACRTVPAERPPHSLHAYFMRPGDPGLPIIYQVFRDRDGGRFSSRRVVALQNGRPILNLAASFHEPEPGLAHQSAMPDVPPPEALRSEREVVADMIEQFPEWRRPMMLIPRALEFRPVAPGLRYAQIPREAMQYYWFRAAAPLPNDALLHRVLLAYASDMMLISTSLLPPHIAWNMDQVQEASLDHAIWLHGDVRLDEWLLYAQDSPWAGQGRGMNRGLIFTRDGRLVASVAQEGLIRVRE